MMRNDNRNILGISFLFFVLVLFAGNIYAENPITSNTPVTQSSSSSDAVWGSIKTAGVLTAGFIGGTLATKLIAGDNQSATSTSSYASSIGSLGALAGGIFGGSGWGSIIGAASGLIGGSIGSIIFATKDSLGTLERGLLTRVIGYQPNEEKEAIFYDTKYKIAGSDTPSNNFSADMKTDKSFVKKEKDNYYQYTPVEIKVNSTTTRLSPIQVAVLNVPVKGLPEYIYAKTGETSSTFANYQTYSSANTTGNTEDPYANALTLDLSGTNLRDMPWCQVDDKGTLAKRDKEVSKKYIEDLADKELKENTESFVLLMKYMSAQEETISTPNYNCFGPNGLTGITGESAKPKLLYEWSSDKDWALRCTSDLNDSGVYCDSTQFTQALLSKLSSYNSLMGNGVYVTTSEDLNYDSGTTNLYNSLHFRAHLMLDGYTKDFMSDFKNYVTQTTFLKFNDNLKNTVNDLFPDKIEFRPLSGETTNPEGYRLPQAGYYNVNIVVTYNEAGNKILENDGKLNSNVKKIIVFFEPISREANPIYYMPLDATVGVDNGVIDRVGYGVDYASETGDAVWFAKTQKENILLEPTLRSNSSPIVHLNIKSYQDTLSLNGNMRGTLLQIVPKSSTIGVTYDVKRYLSLPALAELTVNKTSEGGAYAYYTVDYGNGPENAGTSFVLWNLYCGKDDKGDFKGDCKSFSGASTLDDMYLPDKLGTFAKVAPTGQLQGKVYGLEWDKDTRIQGINKSTYVGAVYLPESTKSGNMNIILASDSASITQTLNPIVSNVSDIQAIFNLMSENLVCMTTDTAGVRFWWNPARIYSAVEN